MKKIAVLTVACSVLAGCSYLGAPESYTIVDETTAPVVQQKTQLQPAPIVQHPTCGCVASSPVMQQSACQLNQGVAGPLVITIPAQTVRIQ